jgi:hypothetical protein
LDFSDFISLLLFKRSSAVNSDCASFLSVCKQFVAAVFIPKEALFPFTPSFPPPFGQQHRAFGAKSHEYSQNFPPGKNHLPTNWQFVGRWFFTSVLGCIQPGYGDSPGCAMLLRSPSAQVQIQRHLAHTARGGKS